VSVTVEQIGVVLVDDDVFVRKGLRTLIEAQPDMHVLGEAGDVEDAVDCVTAEAASVVVAEARFRERGAVGLLDELRRRGLDVGVVVLTRSERDDDVLRLVQAGASAYLRKTGSSSDLLLAVRTVAAGGHMLEPQALDAVLHDYCSRSHHACGEKTTALTLREREVLTLVAEGRSTRQIAEELSLSHKTIEVHRRRIMDKLGMHKVADLVRYAVREGLVNLDLA
jgi:DNA-binding NarL/FixJ family response regulator